MRPAPEMQTGDLARRLGLRSTREIRYLLEERFSDSPPRPGDQDLIRPSQGCARILDGGVQFWLACAIKLKRSGLKTPAAMALTEYAKMAMKEMSRRYWDPDFDPFNGYFTTRHQWYIELGDKLFVRLATTAAPTKPRGRMFYTTDWAAMAHPRTPLPQMTCSVILQLDLTMIAQELRGSDKIILRRVN